MDLSGSSPWTCESNVDINAANVNVLKRRLANLKFVDLYFPLSISSSVHEIHDVYPVLGLHDAVGLSLDHFVQLATIGQLWKKFTRQSWSSVFKTWGLSHSIQTRHWLTVEDGGSSVKVTWANFYAGASERTDPQAFFSESYESLTGEVISLLKREVESDESLHWRNCEIDADLASSSEVASVQSKVHAPTQSSGGQTDTEEGISCASVTTQTASIFTENASVQAAVSTREMSTQAEVTIPCVHTVDTSVDEGATTQPTSMTSGHSHVDIPSEARNLYDRLSRIQDVGVQALVLQLLSMEELSLGACVRRANDRGAGLSIKEQAAVKAVVKFEEEKFPKQRKGVFAFTLSGVGRGSKESTYVRFPTPKTDPFSSDDVVNSTTIEKRTNLVSFCMESLNVGQRVLVRLFKRDQWRKLVEIAVSRSQIFTSRFLNAEQTTAVLHSCGGSWGSLRVLRAHLVKLGIQMESEANLKADLEEVKQLVDTSLIGITLEGTKGDCESLCLIANAMQLLVVDLDLAYADGFVDHFNDGKIYISFTQDKGQDAGKAGLAVLNVHKPVGWFNIALFLVTTPKYHDQKSKPKESHKNFKLLLPQVPWYTKIQYMAVVRCGDRACLIPAISVPEDRKTNIETLESVADLEKFIELSVSYTRYSNISEDAFDSAPEFGARAVVYEGNYVGMRAGDVYVTFNARVPVIDTKVTYHDIVLTATLDFLAAAVFLGMEGQSSVNSLTLRASGCATKATISDSVKRKGQVGLSFKTAACGEGLPLEERTDESQVADLQTYLELKKKIKTLTHVMGVNGEVLLPCPVKNSLCGGLHLSLGAINLQEKLVRKDLEMFQGCCPIKQENLREIHTQISEIQLHIANGLVALGREMGTVVSDDTDISMFLECAEGFVNQLSANYNVMRNQAEGFGMVNQMGPVLGQLHGRIEWVVKSVAWVRSKVGELASLEATKKEIHSQEPSVLMEYWENILVQHAKVSKEVYWLHTMNGPSCRRYIENAVKLIEMISAKLLEMKYTSVEVQRFAQRHIAVIEPLGVASELCRVARVLSEEEISTLVTACKKVGSQWRLCYPEHKQLTPKLLAFEVDIPRQARKWKSIGLFGEDGMEDLHPKWRDAMNIVRSMRNPEAKLKAGLDKLILQRQHHRRNAPERAEKLNVKRAKKEAKEARASSSLQSS